MQGTFPFHLPTIYIFRKAKATECEPLLHPDTITFTTTKFEEDFFAILRSFAVCWLLLSWPTSQGHVWHNAVCVTLFNRGWGGGERGVLEIYPAEESHDLRVCVRIMTALWTHARAAAVNSPRARPWRRLAEALANTSHAIQVTTTTSSTDEKAGGPSFEQPPSPPTFPFSFSMNLLKSAFYNSHSVQ